MKPEPKLQSAPPAPTPPDDQPSNGGYYTPGYRKSKLLMAIVGMAILGCGVSLLWTPLSLLFHGEPAMAEATRVLKTKPGQPDTVFISDTEIKKAEETRDRSYVFVNEFAFHTKDGELVTVRYPGGAHPKPIFKLLDKDGLPTTLTVRYDPQEPQKVVFPVVINSLDTMTSDMETVGGFFLPGAVVMLGLFTTIIGSMLFYRSNKPIEMPYIAPPPTVKPDQPAAAGERKA